MSSFEEIANEVAPLGAPARGLATGAHRKRAGDPENNLHLVSSPPCASDTPLQEILRGKPRANLAGEYFYIKRAAHEFGAEFADLQALLGGATSTIGKETRAEQLLFVDIETTGLSSRGPLFLIGALHSGSGQGAVLEQFLARDLGEERAAIAAFLENVAGRTLVTFNGKRFDWPFIENRARHHGLKVPEVKAHFDLLHHARRKWKMLVPNCRLQTLELHLCKRKREGDIPSSKIPDQYYDFAELHADTGSGAHLITPIVHHNIWDVLTMADLLRRCS